MEQDKIKKSLDLTEDQVRSDKFVKASYKIMEAVVQIIYVTLVWAFVCMKLYWWFLLSIFPSLPAISFLEVIGIKLTIKAFIGVSNTTIKREYRNIKQERFNTYIGPWVILLIAWIIKISFFA